MKRQSRIGILALMVMAGCAPPGSPVAGDAALPITALANQNQCGALDQPAVRWISDSGAWRALYAQINRQRMNPPPPPPVDFPRAGVLLIAMGQRSTAGYGLALADEVATVRGVMLTVRVSWREPLPGARRAQVMTNPCLLATLPDAGFTQMQVLDQEGQVRLEGER